MLHRVIHFGGRSTLLVRPSLFFQSPTFTATRILSSDSSSTPPGVHIPEPLIKEKRTFKIFPFVGKQKDGDRYGKEASLSKGHSEVVNPGPPVTLDAFPVPSQKYETVYRHLQSKFNMYLYAGIALLACSLFIAIKEDYFIIDSFLAPESYRKRKKYPVREAAPPAVSPSVAEVAPVEESEPVASVAAIGAPLTSAPALEEVSTAIPEQLERKETVSEDPTTSTPAPPPRKPRKTPEVAAMPVVVDKIKMEEPKVKASEQSDVGTGRVIEAKKQTIPYPSTRIPEEIPYLLIGSGTAAYYAALAIRARDAEAKVLMVGSEKQLPYSRPPLSKELWWYGDDKMSETLEYQGLTGRKKDVFYEARGFYVPSDEIEKAEHGGVSLVAGRRVVELDIPNHTAYLDDGRSIKYGKCLIATGGSPRSLPVIEKAGEEVRKKVTLFRTIEDLRKLDEVASKARSIAIIGGGFLGSELAYSLNRRYGESKGLKVYQIFREKGNVAHVLPEFLSELTTKELKNCGVNVLTEQEVTEVSVDDHGCVKLRLTSGESLHCDHVVVAVGIDPNTELAKSSGLEVDQTNGGFIVDAELRARSDVWVAGDASSFYDVKLGRRRVEHWQHAQVTGRLAGENMTGANKPYWHRSSFYSLIAPDAHFQAVGKTDSSLPTVSVFAADDGKMEETNRGVVFYMDGRVIVGVVLFNVFGSGIDVARRIIADGREHRDLKEVAKLFEIHRNEKEEKEEETSEKDSH